MRSSVIVHTPEDFNSWLEENRIAQNQEINKAIAVNPKNLSTSEFLAPYAREMGINSETLAQLHPQS
jgi:cytochrome c oxidase subunit 2